MNEHDANKPPAEAASEVSADPIVASPALIEVVAPPLSPGEPMMIETPTERIAEPGPKEAEVIMLPAKFAAFLAASTARFRERARAMPISGRQVAAVALMIAVAGASAVGGALFSARSIELAAAERSEQAEQARVLRESVARIESELAALRGNIERTAKLSTASASKTGERLDRIEKAQAEPAARLAKLTDSVEKLRATAPATAPAATVAAAQPPAAAAVPARDVTGSISAPSSSTVAKTDPAKPAIVDGWVLRDAQKGAALIEGRNGLLEVYVGDSIPGIGRVDAVRRQDGQWTVVTAKGLIVGR